MGYDPFGIYGNPTAGTATAQSRDPFGVGGQQASAPLTISNQTGLPQGLALQGGAPAAGNKTGLFFALNQLGNFNGDDQARIVSRAAQAGLVDRNQAASFLKQNLGQPAQMKLNPFEKAANMTVGIAKDTAKPFVYAAKQFNKNIVQPFTQPAGSSQDIKATQAKAQQAAQSKIIPQTQSLINKVQSPNATIDLYKAIANPNISDAQVQNQALKQLQQEDAYNKKALGTTAQLVSYGLGGGELGNVAKGASSFIKPVLANAAAGYVGTVGSNLADNPQAGFKDLQKGAALNTVIVGGGTALAGGLGAVIKARGAAKDSAQQLLTNTATQSLIGQGQQANKYSALGQIAGREPPPITDAAHLLPSPQMAKQTRLAQINTRLNELTQTAGTKFEAAQPTMKNIGTSILKTDVPLKANGEPDLRFAASNKQAVLKQGATKAVPNEPLAEYKALKAEQASLTQDLTKTQGKSMGVDVGQPGATTLEAKVQPASIEGPAPARPRPATTTPFGYTKDVQQTLNNATVATNSPKSTLGKAWQDISTAFSPVHGPEADTVRSQLRSTLGDITQSRAQEQFVNQSRTGFFAKQPDGANLNFIQRIESGVKQPTAALQSHADFFKNWFAKDYTLAQKIDPNVPQLPNYFAHSGMWENPQAVENWARNFSKGSLTGTPGALAERQYPTVYDAIKAGMVPKETNPMTIALNNRNQLDRALAMQQTIDKMKASGINPDTIQAFANRLSEKGLQNSAIFQAARQAGGSLNQTQLGLSAFHGTKTGLDSVISKGANVLNDLFSGHPLKAGSDLVQQPIAAFKGLAEGRTLRDAYLSNDLSNPMVKYMKASNLEFGHASVAKVNDITKSVQDFSKGKYVSGTVSAVPRLLATTAKPLMEWWVPNLKAGVFAADMRTELARLGSGATEAEKVLAAQRVGDSIENRLGQVNTDNLMWNGTLKDLAKVSLRSSNYTFGTGREIGGGISDLVAPNIGKAKAAVQSGQGIGSAIKEGLPTSIKSLVSGQGVTPRSAYTLSLMANTALLGAVTQYLYTGKFPTEAKDFFYPKTGQTDKNGNPERVALPTYAKDVFSFIHNPVQTLTNKSNPLLSLGSQVIKNKDFFGNQVRNTNDSAGTQAKQVEGYLAKNLLPFSITNTGKRVDQSVGTKVQSLLGITVAPQYIAKTPLEQQVNNALNHALGQKSQTPEEQAAALQKTQAAQATGKSQLERQLSLLMTADRPAAAQIINNASPKDLQSLPPSLINQIQKTAAYTALGNSTTTKQTTKDASNSLLQKLGGNPQDLYNQKKADLQAAAAARPKKTSGYSKGFSKYNP